MYIYFDETMNSSEVLANIDELDGEKDGLVQCYQDLVMCSPDSHLDGFVPIFLNPVVFDLGELTIISSEIEELLHPDIIAMSDHTIEDKEWLDRPPASSIVVKLNLMEYTICFQDNDANSIKLMEKLELLDPSDEEDEKELDELIDELIASASSKKVIVLAEAFF